MNSIPASPWESVPRSCEPFRLSRTPVSSMQKSSNSLSRKRCPPLRQRTSARAAAASAALPLTPTGLASNIEDGRGVPMVLVSSGEFLMGSNFGGNEEQPEHTVSQSAFYIDAYEVLNSRYAQCVSEGACDPPTQFNSSTRSSYYGNPEFADFPVVMVTWNMAQEYCSWRGASLPTQAQWEKAPP